MAPVASKILVGLVLQQECEHADSAIVERRRQSTFLLQLPEAICQQLHCIVEHFRWISYLFTGPG
jgi:hypothetical protein